MAQFSVRWATAAPAYVGMLVGVTVILCKARTVGHAAFGVIAGLFVGGAVGLPAVAANLVAASAVRLFMRSQPFAAQFAGFALGSVMLNTWLLFALDRGMGPMGRFLNGPQDLLLWCAFGAASLLLAWTLMVLGVRPAV